MKFLHISFLIVLLVFISCAKTPTEETPVTSDLPDLPDISTLTTSPATQFIIDTSLIGTAAIDLTTPFSGTGSSCPHLGAHIHFRQTGSPSLVNIYSPVNGIINRLDKCYIVGANDKYEIEIGFAKNSGKTVSLSLSLEPFAGYACSGGVSGTDNGAFHGYILVNSGDAVTAGQLIARMYVPAGAAADTHIHFHLNTDTVGFSCPNIFSTAISSVYDDKFSSAGCSGGAYPSGGLCSQPGPNEDLTTLD